MIGQSLVYGESIVLNSYLFFNILLAILKSMVGKDVTKITLPVSFNEATSLLQRVAEDMEYIDLIDIAVTLPESCDRMLYVAAFAISEVFLLLMFSSLY